ncbi:MAG: hypothetical protein JNK74_21090 [Candidatus Hydrogenedentes bacterium]|nr:hypothetical protein [Candidatus Hydrogenedentota bacterium]
MLAAGRSLRPGLRYGLLLVVLLKFAVPPVFGVAYGFSDLLARAFTNEPAPLVNSDLRVTVEKSPAPATPSPIVPVAPVMPPAPVLSPKAWLLLLEAAGAIAILVLIARQWLAAREFMKQGAGADEALQERFNAAVRAMKLRRAPRLCLSESVGAPQSGGILRPFVILPAWVATMPDEELDILLAHELAHIRRMDALVNSLQAAAQALLWWNPAVWWLNRRIREEREFCCDDLVLSQGIASGAAYSRTLVNVAERVSLPQSSWAMAGMADNFGAIDRRVRRALEGGYTESGWRRYGALVTLLLVAGWVLPGATEEEVKAGAGAAVGVDDSEGFAKRGIRPSWPMVKYSLEEFLNVESGARDRVAAPEADGMLVRIAVRGIQVDRTAELVLPDGKTLAERLNRNDETPSGEVSDEKWTSFGARLQSLRESGEADFTYVGCFDAGAEPVLAVIPTALDGVRDGRDTVEFIALQVKMLARIVDLGNQGPSLDLNLALRQPVVAGINAGKMSYNEVATSSSAKFNNMERPGWIYLVSETNADRVNVVCIRPERIAKDPEETETENFGASLPRLVVNAETIHGGFPEGKIESIDDATLVLKYEPQGEDVTIHGKRLAFDYSTEDPGLVTISGSMHVTHPEMVIDGQRLEIGDALLFFDVLLETEDFGKIQAEQVRVDPVGRRLDILNGTVDETRLKAALGESAKNAAKGEWLTLPFAVVRQIAIDTMIVEMDRDADFSIPDGPQLTELISGNLLQSDQARPESQNTENSEADVTGTNYALWAESSEKWSSCVEFVHRLVGKNQARLLSAPKIIANAGQKESISIGKAVPSGEEGQAESDILGFSLEIIPTLKPSKEESEFIGLEIAFKLTTQGASVEDTPVEKVDELYTKLILGESGRWLCQMLGPVRNERVKLLFLKADIVGGADAPGNSPS